MKKQLLVILVILLTSILIAETNIASDVTTDTLWDLDGAPYVIWSTISVVNNVTLTIEPGVVVEFLNNVSLNVSGNIQAIGNQDNHIIFINHNENGHWKGIDLKEVQTPILIIVIFLDQMM